MYAGNNEAELFWIEFHLSLLRRAPHKLNHAALTRAVGRSKRPT
jgi:hypothetical protein